MKYSYVAGPPTPTECYMSEFLEKYVLDSDTDSEGRKIPVLRTEPEVEENVLFEIPPRQGLGLSSKLGRAVGNIASYMTGTEPQHTPAVKHSQRLVKYYVWEDQKVPCTCA